jgi:hypothetical protein
MGSLLVSGPVAVNSDVHDSYGDGYLECLSHRLIADGDRAGNHSAPSPVSRIGLVLMAAIGYLLTGEPASAIVTGLAIVAFRLCGPNVFAKA